MWLPSFVVLCLFEDEMFWAEVTRCTEKRAKQ